MTSSVVRLVPSCQKPSKRSSPTNHAPVAPGKFTPEPIALILTVAREPPEKAGRLMTRWPDHKRVDDIVKGAHRFDCRRCGTISISGHAKGL